MATDPSGLAPRLLSCPHCRQPVQAPPKAKPGQIIVLDAEEVVCPACHGVAVDAGGQLRKPFPVELAAVDWTEYRRVCRDLVAAFGPPMPGFPCPTPPPR